MLDLEEMRGRSFRILLAVGNYQAVFGALMLGLIGLAAIAWHERTALFLALASAFLVFASHVIAGRAFTGLTFFDREPSKISILATKALWYAAIAFGALSFAALN